MRLKILFLFALCLSVWQAQGQSPQPAVFGNVTQRFWGNDNFFGAFSSATLISIPNNVTDNGSAPCGGSDLGVSYRWTQSFTVSETGTYSFGVVGPVDNQVDIRINTTLVCSHSGVGGSGVVAQGTINLIAGTTYLLQTEYRNYSLGGPAPACVCGSTPCCSQGACSTSPNANPGVFSGIQWRTPGATIFSDLPNPQLWLRADNANVATTAPNLLTTWSDISNIGNDFASVNNKRPIFSTSTTAFNYNSYVHFNSGANNDEYVVNNTFKGFGTEKVSYFAVVQPDQNNRTSEVISNYYNGEFSAYNPSNINVAVKESGLNGTATLQSVTGTVPAILSIMYDDALPNNELRTYRNGGNLQQVDYDITGVLDGSGNENFFIGNEDASNTTTGPFKGKIAEMLVFNNAISVADREQIESYLAIK